MTRFQEGDWVHIDHHGPHSAVVLRIRSERAILIYATSRARYQSSIEVLPDSADGKRLDLPWVTYFYAQNCIPMPLARMRPKNRRCPLPLLLRLRLLCEKQLAEMDNMHEAELDALTEQMTQRGVKSR
jgi:hypothetical protein